MELLFGIVLGLFILVLLVVVHEIGHGIVARRNGVVVEEFGVGFPPLAWGKNQKDSSRQKRTV
jgi:regulator of sigma E protease